MRLNKVIQKLTDKLVEHSNIEVDFVVAERETGKVIALHLTDMGPDSLNKLSKIFESKKRG